MSKIPVAIIVAPFLSMASSSGYYQEHAAAGPAQDTEAAIQAVHLQLRQAAERLDAGALYAHVLDTSTPPIIENGRMASSRAAALESTTLGLQQLASLSYTYTHQNLTVLSPSTVLWVADGTAAGTLKDGRQVTAPFAETVVFVLRDGEWKVLHAHRSSPNAR